MESDKRKRDINRITVFAFGEDGAIKCDENMSVNNIKPIQDEIVLYQSEDGNVKVDVLFQDETVWLTQEQMAQLFGKGRTTITEHIGNIFKEGELDEEKVCRKFRHATQHVYEKIRNFRFFYMSE